LNAALETYFVQRSSADWVEQLNVAGVPCGPIYRIDQVFKDPQVEHLGIVQGMESLRVVGQPMTLGRTPSGLAAAPPGRGQHTAEVLREVGFSDAEIEALQKAKVV
jgi:formyl-CoA transferase